MAIDTTLAPGTVVEVSNLFTGTWSRGFRVVSREAGAYRLARLSDGSELPALFSPYRLRVDPSAVERDRVGLEGADLVGRFVQQVVSEV